MGVRSPLEPRMRAQRDVLAVEWNGSVNAVRYKHVQTSFWVLEDEMLPRRISQARNMNNCRKIELSNEIQAEMVIYEKLQY